jgi:Fe-Mn family superoxide dismutase
MPTIHPQSFPHLPQCDAISPKALDSHLQLYAGYVKKYNDLMEKLRALQAHGPAAVTDRGSVKGDIAFALGAIKNHELYFQTLGLEGGEPSGVLAEMIVKSFHSVPQFLVDLKQTAQHGRGWVWTAYDLDHDYLFNYEAGAQNGLPVWNALPVLAIDLYGHAYFYDYGNNKIAYVEAVMKGIHWPGVGERLAAARSLATQLKATVA